MKKADVLNSVAGVDQFIRENYTEDEQAPLLNKLHGAEEVLRNGKRN